MGRQTDRVGGIEEREEEVVRKCEDAGASLGDQGEEVMVGRAWQGVTGGVWLCAQTRVLTERGVCARLCCAL